MIIVGHESSVRRALVRADVWTRTFRALGLRETGAGRDGADLRTELRPGEAHEFRHDVPWGRPASATLRVLGTDNGLPQAEIVFGPVRARIDLVTKATGGGTLATVDLVLSTPRLLLAHARRRFVEFGEMLLAVATLAAHDPEVVVAAAVIRDGRVLAARRTRPPELAGLWEMPGGKVEPGEGERAALVRELAEELGIAVRVGKRVGPACDVGQGRELRAYLAAWESGDPTPLEVDPAHDQVRWIVPAELQDLDWLPNDRPFVEAVHQHLSQVTGDCPAP